MKHTDAGGVTVSVSVSERVGNDVVVEMDVVDTGEGIPQEELGSIFDAYEQAGGGAVRRKGTGLGLSICRQLVGLMGGRIWAESELGHGSAFHVTVPLGIHLGNVQLIQPVRSELDDLPVLVVASSRFIKERYVMAAEQIGLSVVSVESRQEAIAALGMASAADHPFALAIVTLDGDGLDFAAELRRRPDLEQMHMLVVTSVGQRGDAKRCHESNIAGYLTMPIGEDELERAIRAVLTGPSPVDLSTLVTKHWLRERRNHLSLLVVDDSPTNRMVARRLLERRGHRVDIAESGYDAIKAVEEHRFDVILLDVQLPDIDAREVASTIRRYGPDTPIIGMASKKTDGLVNVMTRTGIDEIISKPLQVAELLRTIESRVEDSSAAGM
jgi:CheY-like chemotaxis protein